MSARLAGKVSVVVGATGAMGREIALAFGTEGSSLVLVGRTLASLEALATEIRGDCDVGVAVVDGDIALDAESVAQRAFASFGRVDVVVITAVPPTIDCGDLYTTVPDAWRELFDVIAWGPVRLLRSLAIDMRERGGSVVTFGSTTATTPTAGYAAYGSAKAVLQSLSRYMAAEWGRWNIRVNCIVPGAVASDSDTDTYAAHATSLGVLRRTSLGRLGASREVVGAALYFASDESSFTSGQELRIDGGRF